MQLLDGVLVSAHIKEQIIQEREAWQASGGKKPHLAAVLVGNNPASEAYVGSKVKHCEELGLTLRYCAMKAISRSNT
jgi:methylenetetrahydrofolate dehydrogenase (NADP+)/methenyltetrahydrofolate cyclohydrolase